MHLRSFLSFSLFILSTALHGSDFPAGYVDDKSCAICHSDQYRPFQEVGMAQSFYRPAPEKDIEDLGTVFFHKPSQRYYEMRRRDGRLLFRRYQKDPQGRPIHEIELEVSWILGSGHRSRTYLYRTEAGDLFQLPIAWYTQEARWGMAPGFDRPDHEGVRRRVRRECLFCHNAYPALPPGGDAQDAAHRFPSELPEGIGCQRCHGPGEEHLRAVEKMNDLDTVRASIVRPASLPPLLRDDVCEQCHLQPLVALAGVRRFGRGVFSYRPGEPLDEYLVQIDAEVEGRPRAERFEINHHPYRLRQSPCFAKSEGALSCLTCHDPHRKVPAEERAAHYRRACLSCHAVEACKSEDAAAADCVSCHMPQRRPQDVVHVVMTDHFIRRKPGGPELIAPREEEEPILVDALPYEPERAPTGDLWQIYRAISVLQTGGGGEMTEFLEKLLARVRPPQIEPALDLAKAQIRGRRFAEAEQNLSPWLASSLEARDLFAALRLDQGHHDEAADLLRAILREDPQRAETRLNLGRAELARGRYEEGLEALRGAVETLPNLLPAWFQLAYALDRLGFPDEAAEAYRRVLEIDPAHCGGR